MNLKCEKEVDMSDDWTPWIVGTLLKVFSQFQETFQWRRFFSKSRSLSNILLNNYQKVKVNRNVKKLHRTNWQFWTNYFVKCILQILCTLLIAGQEYLINIEAVDWIISQCAPGHTYQSQKKVGLK